MKEALSPKEVALHCLSDGYVSLFLSGKEEIGVNDVCRKAGFSRSSFYRYFGKSDYQKECMLFYLSFRYASYRKEDADFETSLDGLLRFAYAHKDLLFKLVEKRREWFLLFLDGIGEEDKEKRSLYLASSPYLIELIQKYCDVPLEQAKGDLLAVLKTVR